jgi:GrpB-like predicted nucleotidyltransferase (UPF0157 family)
MHVVVGQHDGQSGSLATVDAGRREAPIVIVDYDPAWPERFAAEAARLEPILGRRVDHIGSTAVPGLAAKPVIDLMALVDDIHAPIDRLVAEAGYVHPSALAPQSEHRTWLCHPSLDERLHHLHLTDDPALLARHIGFRDALRADPQLCADYAALKRDLARRLRTHREAYAEAKTEFIDAVVGPR